jgi:ABC-type transport system involved in cytochrome bd biosynthesis fused ATPase/permease subunit
MTNKITITVSGVAGSGKSAIIELINDAIADAGLDVEVNHLDIADRVEWRNKMSVSNRIQALINRKIGIEIFEKQKSRSAE